MNTLFLSDVQPKTIYSNAGDVITGETLLLYETKQNYVLPLNATQSLSIDTSQLSNKSQLYSMSFSVEVNCSGHYVINFQGCSLQQMEFFYGCTKLHFTKSQSSDLWDISILEYGGIAPYYYREGINYRREVCLAPCTNRTAVPLIGYFPTPTTINSDNLRQTFEGTDIYFDGVSLNPFILTQLNCHVQNTTFGTEASHPEQMFLYGSNDYENWTLLYSNGSLNWDTNLGTIQTYTPSIIRPFKYFRFRFIQSSAQKISLSPMSLIGIGSELLYCGAIVQFPAITGSINGYDVSINTSDGVALADSTTVYGCTNGNSTSLTRSNTSLPWIITYTYPSASRPIGFRIGKYSDWNANTPDWFAWYGSDDGITWTKAIELRGILKIAEGIAGSNDYEDYMCDFGSSYKYWQLRVYAAKSSTVTKIRVKEAYPLTSLYQYSKFESIVPAMRSDVQDGYTVTASNTTDGAAYKMYDRNVSTYSGGSMTEGVWATTIDMGEPVIVRGVQMQTTSAADRMPTTFKIQGSTNGINWTDLSTQTLGSTFWTSLTSGTIGNFEFPNDTAYQYYRLYVTATAQGTYVRICELGWTTQIRGNPVDYYTEELLTPVMASNSQDGYVITASDYAVGATDYYPWKAFDRNASDIYSSWGVKESTSAWIKVELPTAKVANKVFLVNAWATDERVENFVLSGSNDDSNYTQLLSQSDMNWGRLQGQTFTFSNTTAYKYYKIEISKASANWMGFTEIQLSYYEHYERSPLYIPPEVITVTDTTGTQINMTCSVPVLTSNNTNGYIASESMSAQNSWISTAITPTNAWNAFDRDNYTFFTSKPAYNYNYGSGVTTYNTTVLRIVCNNSIRNIPGNIIHLLFTQYYYPVKFTIRGTDGSASNYSDWTTVYTATNNSRMELVIELDRIYNFYCWEIRVTDISIGSHIEVRRFDIGIKNS